ncbi:MAG: LPS export ABC transporter permease LptG [Methylococcales bacterium]|nr:LPS export ABC transporter permease LptG [Methylococcales bacterium]
MTVLQRYLLTHLSLSWLLAAAVLLPLFSFFDLQQELDDVGEGIYQTRDAFFTTALLLPRRFIQLSPFIALLGTVIALGRLAVSLELTAMRGAGLSPLQIGRAPVMLGLVYIIAIALTDQFIAPVLQQKAIAEQNLGKGLSAELGKNLGIWTRDTQQIVRIGAMAHSTLAKDIEIFRFNPEGWLETVIQAERADMSAGQVWQLQNVTVRSFSDQGLSIADHDTMSWSSFMQPQQITTLTKPPESLSPLELLHHINFLKATEQPAQAFILTLWRKPGSALLTLALLLLSLLFVFGSVRRGIANQLVITTLLGIGIYVLDQIIANLGLLFEINAVLVAFLPGLSLLALAYILLRRLR